ncbi:16S rRNA (cytosine(1402)-N(4))-methyltransferase RsmH [Demetria terragena]|uniref:16S rRNA (cytosine(1402)-N(4))-methyltransferase RsmH n=1 Tax=Demetria terragena TaxID=63959 RepID=UPI00035E07A9|nr:16S rRNA (cytosine(1402)-N(4))-methyltransferase RsmH [Demetria terragena]
MAHPPPTAERHTPVLRNRIVDLLAPALTEPGSVLVDATLGMGGHTEALLEACPNARVLGIDRDTQALDLAGERLAPFGERFTAVQAVYDELPEVLAEHGMTRVQAVLFDLGVSSLQLDEADRGFAYRHDAPLDMRMSPDDGPTAADVLNTYSAADLERILRDFGEERFARRIARSIVERRATVPFARSAELVDLLRAAIPAASQRTGGHPAKRTFQALRIEVNGELDAWQRALPAAVDALAVDGRIAVLSYHSLEDRIAKRALARAATSTTPPGLPVELPEHAPYVRLLTRGAETADSAETEHNPRATPARLRAAIKVRIPEVTTR